MTLTEFAIFVSLITPGGPTLNQKLWPFPDEPTCKMVLVQLATALAQQYPNSVVAARCEKIVPEEKT